jgi:hypothetical protein
MLFKKRVVKAEAEFYKEIAPLVIVVSKDDVEVGNIAPTLQVLQTLLESPDKIRIMREKVEISFHGYDQFPQELDEIPAVRNFVAALDHKFPYWLYFLTKHFTGLQCIVHCFLLPYLTPQAYKETNLPRVQQLLETRWFPAMNHLAEIAGISEELIEHMTEKVTNYLINGPIPLENK